MKAQSVSIAACKCEAPLCSHTEIEHNEWDRLPGFHWFQSEQATLHTHTHTAGVYGYDSLGVTQKVGMLSNPNKQLSGDSECLSVAPRYYPFNKKTISESSGQIIEATFRQTH